MFEPQFLLQRVRTGVSERRLVSLALKNTVIVDTRIHDCIFPLLQFPEEALGVSFLISLTFVGLGTHFHAQASAFPASALPLFFMYPVPWPPPSALSGAHGPQSLPPSHWCSQNRRRWIKTLGLLACGMDPLVSPQTNPTLA